MDFAVLFSTTQICVFRDGVRYCSLWEIFFRASDIMSRLMLEGSLPVAGPTVNIRTVLEEVGKKRGYRGKRALKEGERMLYHHGFTFNRDHNAISYDVDVIMDSLPGHAPSMTVIHGEQDFHVPIGNTELFVDCMRKQHPSADIQLFRFRNEGHGFLSNAAPRSVQFLRGRLLHLFQKEK